MSLVDACRVCATYPADGSKPSDEHEAAVDELVRGGFLDVLEQRVADAALNSPEVSRRFPEELRQPDGKLDQMKVKSTANHILFQMLRDHHFPGDTSIPGDKRNAFGAMLHAMELYEGDVPWSDGHCVQFLLGPRGVRFPLPRPGQMETKGPAWLRWVAQRWRPDPASRLNDEAEIKSIWRNTANEDASRRVANSGTKFDGRTGVVLRPDPGDDDYWSPMVEALSRWPADLKALFRCMCLEGPNIVKVSAVKTVLEGTMQDPQAISKCFNVSAVVRHLGKNRLETEELLNRFVEKLLDIPISRPLTQSEIRRLMEVVSEAPSSFAVEPSQPTSDEAPLAI